MYRVLSLEDARAEARRGRRVIPCEYFASGGEMAGQLRRWDLLIEDGRVEAPEFDRPLGELLTTPSGLEAFVLNTVIQLNLGREEVPLLYGPIYRRLEDANFSQTVEVRGLQSGRAQAVFLEHLEGEEIRFGSRTFLAKDSVPIITYATGFQWTEDMVLYDKTWEVNETSRAIGEAYNALLNHVHLYPIISQVYGAPNQTAADATQPTLREQTRQTLVNAFQNSALDVNAETRRGRRPTVLLAHSSRRFQVEDSMQRMLISGTEYPAFTGIEAIIYYDGYSITVGEKTYTYGGCPTGKGYLIEPRTYFRELVKHDLRTDAGNPDLSRLIENQVVSRARRGVYAAPLKAVEEITWP